MWLDVKWYAYPKEIPFSFPGNTMMYVTVKDKNGVIYSQFATWSHLEQKFDVDNVIAFAYIPHANAYIPEVKK